nr:Hpt domain-containing protein [Elainella sp. Prado103]
MSKDKEFEIQMQFLDEASDYIDVLDEALLALSQRGVETDKINAALRSAHSIKGGAGMMGFEVLSALSHQLEDSLKVLKVDRSIPITDELEQLLLAGVNCLRSVIHHHRQYQSIDPNWLEVHAQPIFSQLHQHLGDPIDEDAQSILSPEDGQDIIRLLFQTEVEGCLQRLEAVIAEQDPRLPEELEILTQELGGLGEMLQLPAFSSLCQSIAAQLKQMPQQATPIAHISLQAWRHSQQLILANQLAALPAAIELPAELAQGDRVVDQVVTADW